MKTQHLMISSLTLILAACGGGGGGGEASAPAAEQPTVTTTVVEETPTIPKEAATTAELVVPSNYNLEQDYDLTVTASTSSFGASSAHLSICTDYTEENGEIAVDFSSCLVKTNIAPDVTATVAVPGDVESLVAVILLLDTPAEPIYRTRQSSGEPAQSWIVE